MSWTVILNFAEADAKYIFFTTVTHCSCLFSLICILLCFNGFLCLLFFHPLCYKQVPFGPLAFMPGKLVHTNEVTVLLGDNWFSKCSAKQAQKIVDHRMNCESVWKRLLPALYENKTLSFYF